jgi:hypothetical protein
MDFASILMILQYPATLCTVGGYYLLTSKQPGVRVFGFATGILGNILWVIYSLSPLQVGLIVTNGFIFAGGLYGFVHNHKDS